MLQTKFKTPFDRVHTLYHPFMRLCGLYNTKDITQELDCQTQDVVLEIGAGTGHYTRHIAPLVKEIYAVDESALMLKHQKAGPNLHIYCGNILHQNFAPSSFDKILLADVFHHIHEPQQLLDLCHIWLKDSGTIVFYEFIPHTKRTKMMELFEKYLFGTVNYRSPTQLSNALTLAGFTTQNILEHNITYVLKATKC
jgi:SAM-dependent methyltransferase